MLYFWDKKSGFMECTTIFRDITLDDDNILVAVRDEDLLDFKNSKYFNDYEEVNFVYDA